MKGFLALLKIDLKLASRNRAVLFFNYLFPLAFFFIFAQMFDAHQGSAILQVVSMVIVLGILGNGLFGAGMRAVQEREENVLRRYKVTPITPVPLLAASMITGVVLFLPSVVLILFLAHQFYGMALPGQLVSLLLFVCLGAIAFRSLGLIIAAVVNSSQESNILIQPIYMTMLFLSGATIPITFMPHWLQNITQFIPATYLMTGIGGIMQRGETIMRELAGGRRAPPHDRSRDLYRDEVFSLGEGGKAARFGQTLGAGGAAPFPLPRRLPGLESARSGKGADPGARSPARADLADPERPHLCRQWQGDRVGRGAREGREDRRDLRR